MSSSFIKRSAVRFIGAAGAGVTALLISCTALAQEHETEVSVDTAQGWIALATPYVLRAIGALVLLIAARIVAGWLSKTVRGVLEAREFDKTLTRFFSALTRIMILLAAVLGILGMFGVETTSFAAVIGAAGLAIGLAFQGTLGSFSSGVLLLTFRPFNVGDYIEAAGASGTVDEIELFTTTLITPDNKKIIVPNSAVTGGNITNYSALPVRRVDVPVGTDYGADLRKTREILEKVVEGIEKRIETPASQVYLAELGASSIDWQLRVWVNTPDYWDVRQIIVRDTKAALDEAGIGIPFPQMDVHLDK